MAEEALQKLEEQLNCSICLHTYTSPKLLQCFHVYCQQCLVPLVNQAHGVSCPNCRQVTPVPEGGVAGLQPAAHINQLLEIQASFRKLGATPERAVGGASGTPSNGTCSEHSKEHKLYCKTCKDLICWKCILKGSKHREHDYEELDEALPVYKEEIMASLASAEKQIMAKIAVSQLDARCKEISDQRAATKDCIHDTFRRLREVLNVRETELIEQLDQLSQGKLKDLAAQRDQIEATLGRCLPERESLKLEGKPVAIPRQPEILKPNTEANIVFLASEDMTAACQKYGQVIAATSADPSKCRATGKDIEVAGKKSVAILQVFDSEDKPYEEPLNNSLECTIVSEMTGTRANCGVARRGPSQYEVSYQPTKGKHQLHMEVKGQHIKGSPFAIMVKSPVQNLGTPLITIGGVKGPWGVAINQKGEVVVAEAGGPCVSVFSYSGEKLRSFSTGESAGLFPGSLGVAVDSVGNIIVTDSVNCCIKKFTPEGKLLKMVEKCGKLTDVAPHGSQVLVLQNDRVFAYDKNLTYSFSFCARAGSGQFNSPCAIACDSAGQIYVADTGNHRIQVFTAGGQYLRELFGQVAAPYGIAVDSKNNVYVSDNHNTRISVFTCGGTFVASFGRKGAGPGELDGPRGLAVDDDGILYVCDYYNGRVQVF